MRKVLMLASVASMIDQFNMPNIQLLQDMGYEVHIACNFKQGNTCDRARIHKLQETLRTMGVCWHSWDCPRNVWPVGKCVRAYMQLLKLTDQYHFAWIHCHSPVGGALARLAAHRRGIFIIYTAHGFHFYQGAPLKNWLLYYPVEKLLAHWTDVLITVNKEDYCLAGRRLKAAKVCRIPGVGIDGSRFIQSADGSREFRQKYGIAQDAIVLLSVGELSKRKDHQVVLTALAGIPDHKVHYIICGQGKLKNALLKQAQRLGIAEQVHFLGYQEKVEPFYQNADLFVFPSRQEGLPVALMEAMASGLACVVSDIRGSRELLPDGCKKSCVCFAPGSAGKLREALKQMIADERLRYECGCRNQEKMREYDWKLVEGRMRTIYRWAQKKILDKESEK